MKKQDNGRKRMGGRRFLSVLLAMSMILTAGSSNAAAGGDYSHQHSDACDEKQATCTLSEAGHVHDETCYAETPAQLCGLEESEGHAHGESCYGEDGTLTCALQESAGHMHGENCRGTVRTLICGLEEQRHVHTEACYEDVLVCGINADSENEGNSMIQAFSQIVSEDQISASGLEENTIQNQDGVQNTEAGQETGADENQNVVAALLCCPIITLVACHRINRYNDMRTEKGKGSRTPVFREHRVLEPP
jgi:hypothetical protein